MGNKVPQSVAIYPGLLEIQATDLKNTGGSKMFKISINPYSVKV
jgi:hypothetical protein